MIEFTSVPMVIIMKCHDARLKFDLLAGASASLSAAALQFGR